MIRKSIYILFVLALALTSFQSVLAADPIFTDDFESGDLLAWTARKTDFGDLAATTPAALQGSYGMRARIDDNTPIYVMDDTPNGEVSYTAKFLFDPNSIGMANRDFHTIFLAKQGPCGSCMPMLRVELRWFNDAYMLRASTRLDNLTWLKTQWFAITDQSHAVEVEWEASEAAGMNNGQLTFYIDSVQMANRTDIDNDSFRVDRVLLGAIAGVDPTTRGTTFFDFFESFK